MSGQAPPPIGDYALVSDSQGAALVSRSGSVDWACVPRFDSPSTFARLLGERAGGWALAPTEAADVERSYVDGTMVLRTVFRTGSGAVAVTDAMPFLPTERGHGVGEAAPHAIVRLVEGLDGDVLVATEVAPRPEYGLTVPRWAPAPGGATCRGGPAAYVLSCPAPLDLQGGTARARFGVRAGQRVGLALRAVDPWEPLAATWSTDQVRAWLYGTVRGWQSWSALHQGYQGPYAELVHHSGRVLQALTYAPSGAIVAAPTTSLPEQVGGSRNWDDRYAWVRDASLTLSALWVAACPDEVAEFFGFFMTAAGGTCEGEDPVQILYGVGGERRLDEQELDHLGGYRDSRPVRVGNGAWRQSQLDVYGELLDAAGLYADRVASFDDATASFLADLADRAATRWEEPDHGMWEMRGGRRQFLYSKLMCWVALDRACALAGSLPAGERAGRWQRERERIRRAIVDQGWSDRAKAFTQAFGHDDLDASALMIPIVGFLPAGDDRGPGHGRRHRRAAHRRAGPGLPLPGRRRARRERGQLRRVHLLAGPRPGPGGRRGRRPPAVRDGHLLRQRRRPAVRGDRRRHRRAARQLPPGVHPHRPGQRGARHRRGRGRRPAPMTARALRPPRAGPVTARAGGPSSPGDNGRRAHRSPTEGGRHRGPRRRPRRRRLP